MLQSQFAEQKTTTNSDIEQEEKENQSTQSAELTGITSDKGSSSKPSKSVKPNKNNTLRLADIILINSPNNEIFNNLVFFVEYIDQKKIIITNIESLSSHKLTIKNGVVGDGSIVEISIIERNPEKGYARQHNLIPGTWINIYFNGNIPAILTGEITNLEEDMIEITSYPDNEVLYIDF